MNANAVALVPADSTQYPVRYEAARKALAECDAIDEVKGWSDKAAALAAYARQAKDTSLHMMALRIQARAERRAGELLKQIPRGDTATRYGQAGAHPPADHGRAGSHPPVTRASAARAAGLSDHQRKTALRIASVPTESFERQVESDSPPTVTALAEQGKASAPPDPVRDTVARARSALVSFARECAELDPAVVAQSFPANEADAIRRHVRTIDGWLDAFVTRLPE